jgi:hypothetical protein
MKHTRLILIPIVALVAALASAPDSAYALDAAPEVAQLDAGPTGDPSYVGTAPAPLEKSAGKVPIVVETDGAAIGVAGELLGAIRAGDWRYVAALLLILTMYAARRLRVRLKIFDGPRGGAILIGLLGTGTAVTMTLLASGPFDWRLLLAGLGLTWTSVGGYQWARDIFWPKSTVTDERMLTALRLIAAGGKNPQAVAQEVLPEGPRPAWAEELL